MAHFLLELGARLELVGLGTKEGYLCPLTQYHLADALGLSSIHVNRVLRELREAGMVTFQNGKVTFDDRDRLVEFVDFDSDYLDDEGPAIW
jgi:CRP-like cAMP-binding protein